MNYINVIIDNFPAISGFVITLLGIGVSCYVTYTLRKVSDKEKEIFKLHDIITNLEDDQQSQRLLRSGDVNQRQFEKLTEKRRIPLERQLEKLTLERQFMLDKIPLVGFFKNDK